MFSFFVKAVSYAMAILVSAAGAGFNELCVKINTGAFPEVYEGDFYNDVPYGRYLDYGAEPAGRVYDIRDFGAATDGEPALNQKAANAAVDLCAQNGGGTVLVAGGQYRTGSVELKSHVTLKIAEGSSLVASHNSADMNLGCLVLAEGCENVKITGPGKLCGEGNYYAKKPSQKPFLAPPAFSDVAVMGSAYVCQVRDGCDNRYGGIAVLRGCTDALAENVVFENSAHWTLKLENCDGVSVNRVIINNNRHITNTDGIDVVYSRNVEIGNVFISTGDDGIVLKNWSAAGILENVYIHDCEVLSCTNSFKIGTETRGIIRNVLVENCRFFMKDIYPGTGAGIALESADGTKLSGVTVRNITMDRVTCPLFIMLGNRNRYPDGTSDFSGSIEDITVENIDAANAERSLIITGVKNPDKGTLYVRNLQLKDFTVEYTKASAEAPFYMPYTPEYETKYPDSGRFLNLPAYGIWARHADGLSIENFNVIPPENTNRMKFVFRDVKNLSLS